MNDYPTMMRDLVLIKHPKKKRSGLELPKGLEEEERMSASRGEAVSCGSKCKEIKVGDTVVWKSFVGNDHDDPLFDDKYWYTIVSEVDIMCYYRKK